MIVHPSAGKHVPLFSLVKHFCPSPLSTVIVGISVFAQWTQSQRNVRGRCLSCLKTAWVCRSAGLMWRHRNSIKKDLSPPKKNHRWHPADLGFDKHKVYQMCGNLASAVRQSPKVNFSAPLCWILQILSLQLYWGSGFHSLILQCCLSVCSVSCWVLILRAV